MPREYREITFSYTELVSAMQAYACSRDEHLPRQMPTKVELRDGEENSAILIFGQDHIRLETIEITAALIAYARKIGVPLPRSARKTLEIVGETALLKTWIDNRA